MSSMWGSWQKAFGSKAKTDDQDAPGGRQSVEAAMQDFASQVGNAAFSGAVKDVDGVRVDAPEQLLGARDAPLPDRGQGGGPSDDRDPDDRAGAMMRLRRYPRGTYGYSLSGVYGNFNRFPTCFMGTGAGLGDLIDKEGEFLSQPVALDPKQRTKDADLWSEKESAALSVSPDEQTRNSGGWLPVETRASMLDWWLTGGVWKNSACQRDEP